MIDINKNIIIKIFTDRISELCKSAKRPQCNPNFINKLGERSNTVFSKLESWSSNVGPIWNPYFKATWRRAVPNGYLATLEKNKINANKTLWSYSPLYRLQSLWTCFRAWCICASMSPKGTPDFMRIVFSHPDTVDRTTGLWGWIKLNKRVLFSRSPPLFLDNIFIQSTHNTRPSSWEYSW